MNIEEVEKWFQEFFVDQCRVGQTRDNVHWLLQRVKDLEEQQDTKFVLINNGWEEERHALKEENMQYKETLSKIRFLQHSFIGNRQDLHKEINRIVSDAGRKE